MEIERRYTPAEFRIDEDGRIEGYAAVFNQWSDDLGYFKERIRPGAFAKTLLEADVRALFNHDPNYVLGRNRAGTLELSEDEHGLFFRVEPPDTGWAQDLRASMKRGDINQGSFSFHAIQDKWAGGNRKRELIEVELQDVSVVTYPAYPQTAISARSLVDQFVVRVQLGEVDAVLIRELINKLEEAALGQEAGAAVADGDLSRVRLIGMARQLEILRRR